MGLDMYLYIRKNEYCSKYYKDEGFGIYEKPAAYEAKADPCKVWMVIYLCTSSEIGDCLFCIVLFSKNGPIKCTSLRTLIPYFLLFILDYY